MARFRNNMRGPEAVAALNSLDAEIQALKGGGTGGTGGTAPVLAAPTGVVSGGATSTSVTLNWNAVAGSYGYNVYRGTTKITATPVVGQTYNATGLTASTQYTFTIKTVNSAGVEGAASAAVTVTTPATGAVVLAAPTGVTASGLSTTSATIGWNAVASASGYNVYRNGAKVNSVAVTGLTYNDAGLTASTQYSWTIKTINSSGVESPASTAAVATTASESGSTQGAPAAVTTSGATSSSMNITWNPVTGSTGYNVYRNGTKVNGPVVYGEGFIDQDLAPSTVYNWSVRSVNSSGVESAASSAVPGATTAAAANGRINGILPMYAEVAELFFEAYEWPWTFTLNDADPRFNIVTLFTLQPAGTPAVENKRNNLGNGTFQFTNAGEDPVSNDKILALHNKGVRIHLGVGGADNGFNFDSHERAVNFLASFIGVVDQLGGIVSGLCWNTFELYMREIYALNPAATTENVRQMVWISRQLRMRYGPNFAFTMAPAPNAFGNAKYAPGSPYDAIVARAFNDNKLLSYVSPQYYDNAQFKDVDDISGYHIQWSNEFGAEKVVVGLSHGNLSGNFNDCPTLVETEREVNKLLLAKPNTMGWYMWSQHDKKADTFLAFYNSMFSKFGVPPLTPIAGGTGGTGGTTPSGESAVTDGFAYSGGQNGAWLDFLASLLRSGTASISPALTGTNQQFGRIMEKSANGNDVFASGNLATYDAPAGKGHGTFYGTFESTTGGGSGESGTGFFLSMAVGPQSYYNVLWTDHTAANNGRRLEYDADENGFVFSVGTGTARVTAKVVGLATIYNAPTTAFNVKAWHDTVAKTINLQVNGGAVVSTACPAFAAGGANYKICTP
ncbi:MAG: Carbohydrate-binding CenC domain protein, partial [Devosia sp.]|nr:Carbohydrate-binding CenC domain protein [Devosia sp.]